MKLAEALRMNNTLAELSNNLTHIYAATTSAARASRKCIMS
jgi:hypothetical protein